MPKYDFDEIEVPSFEPIPRGKYPLVISNAEFGQSQNGNDMVSLELTVMEEEEEYKGRKIFHNLVLQENSMGFVKAFMISLGLDTNDLNDFDFEDDIDQLIDMSLIAVVKVTKDQNGEDRNAISRTFPYE